MDAFVLAIAQGAVAFMLVWPLAILAGSVRARSGVIVTAVAGGIAGMVFAYLPAASRLPVETSLLKGATLWAGLCLLLAVLDVVGLGALRRRHPAVHLSIVFGLAATALPLSGVLLVREVRTVAFLKESSIPWAFALAGLLVAAVSCWLLSRLLARVHADRYATMWGYLLVAPVIRIAVQPSVVSNVEAIISRVSHDAMHVLIMLLQVPDHMYLSGIVWTLIGLVFVKTTGLILNIAVYVAIVLFVVLRQAAIPLPLKEGENPAQRRRRWTTIKMQRRIAFAPVLISVLVFVGLAYGGWSSAGTPKTPTPVAFPAEGIETAALVDGELHSFTFGTSGEMRAIAILKPDGTYAVCLDACLVCAPDGYAQLGGDLFCLYCGTPIPIATVGSPGGCNPIPLEFSEKDGRLVFDTVKAAQLWREANGGK